MAETPRSTETVVDESLRDSDSRLGETRPRATREPTFEQSLAELEQIVRQLEEGQLGLSDSLARYELGVKRLRECYQLLERAERRIELLERVDAGGEPVTRPFDAEATIDRHALADAHRLPLEAHRAGRQRGDDGVGGEPAQHGDAGHGLVGGLVVTGGAHRLIDALAFAGLRRGRCRQASPRTRA